MAWAVLTRAPKGLVVRRPIHNSSVEQFAQKALATTLMAPLVAVLSAIIAMAATLGHSETTAAQWPGDAVTGTALDDLVEFAPIEPNPAALRAIVNLDALTLAHDEIDAACRAQQPLGGTAIYHNKFLCWKCWPVSRSRHREDAVV